MRKSWGFKRLIEYFENDLLFTIVLTILWFVNVSHSNIKRGGVVYAKKNLLNLLFSSRIEWTLFEKLKHCLSTAVKK